MRRGADGVRWPSSRSACRLTDEAGCDAVAVGMEPRRDGAASCRRSGGGAPRLPSPDRAARPVPAPGSAPATPAGPADSEFTEIRDPTCPCGQPATSRSRPSGGRIRGEWRDLVRCERRDRGPCAGGRATRFRFRGALLDLSKHPLLETGRPALDEGLKRQEIPLGGAGAAERGSEIQPDAHHDGHRQAGGGSPAPSASRAARSRRSGSPEPTPLMTVAARINRPATRVTKKIPLTARTTAPPPVGTRSLRGDPEPPAPREKRDSPDAPRQVASCAGGDVSRGRRRDDPRALRRARRR